MYEFWDTVLASVINLPPPLIIAEYSSKYFKDSSLIYANGAGNNINGEKINVIVRNRKILAEICSPNFLPARTKSIK